jgi:hypothetical protein
MGKAFGLWGEGKVWKLPGFIRKNSCCRTYKLACLITMLFGDINNRFGTKEKEKIN